jgi:hypothetical protein
MLGSEWCLGSGLTTQQAAALGGLLAAYPTLPDVDTLTALRTQVVSTAYGVGREGIRTAEDVQAEQEQPSLDLTDDAQEDIVDWDAASALPDYLEQLNVPSIDELKPSNIDALLALAGGHSRDLVAYLLAQPVALKPTVKRALKAWGK